jgi:hypothetical protein
MPVALLALAISAFGIGTTEFAVAGLLPDIAADLGVDIPTAGMLVTGTPWPSRSGRRCSPPRRSGCPARPCCSPCWPCSFWATC